MEPDDLLCSRNARPYHRRRIRLRLRLSTDQSDSAFFGALNLDLSLGLPMRRAQWKINQPPSLRDNERAWRREGEWPGALLVRRTRTIRMCSFDARSWKSTGPLRLARLARPACLARLASWSWTRAVGEPLARPQGRREDRKAVVALRARWGTIQTTS